MRANKRASAIATQLMSETELPWKNHGAPTRLTLGGYSAGVDGNNNRLNLIKLTEHNLDVYGLFTNLLEPLTGDAKWTRHPSGQSTSRCW